jgi:hypothetical protein
VRLDPGPCPICGAAHTACTADSGPVTITQLPQRDALLASAAVTQRLALEAERVPATRPAGTFTTGTYQRKGPAR